MDMQYHDFRQQYHTSSLYRTGIWCAQRLDHGKARQSRVRIFSHLHHQQQSIRLILQLYIIIVLYYLHGISKRQK